MNVLLVNTNPLYLKKQCFKINDDVFNQIASENLTGFNIELVENIFKLTKH